MKNPLKLILIFVFISSILYSQERFWGLYPGWKINKANENNNGYTLIGSDTINQGYANTPIIINIDQYGNQESVVRYINDTVDGITTYSPNVYSFSDEYISVYGSYIEYYKDYNLFPILMTFNKTDFSLESIVNLKTYFENRSAIIWVQKESGNGKNILAGNVQYSRQSDAPTFFGFYDPITDTLIYKVYDAPSHCRMTPYQIFSTVDGGYLLSCEQDMTYSYPEEVYACILKLDSEGNEQWRYVVSDRIVETIYGPAERATYRPRIFDSPDGNFWLVWTDPRIITPTYMGGNDDCRVWIAKLTDNGDSCTLTEERDLMHEFDDPEQNWWLINDSYQAVDGTMYILLQNFWDYKSAMAKIHPNGVGAWFRTYKCYPEDVGSSYTYLKGMTATSDGGFMLTGGYLNHGTEIFPEGIIASVVFKVDSCGCFEEEGCNDHCMDSYSEHYVYMAEASVYPNPASDKITVSFDYQGGETEFEYKIYSLDGKAMQSGTFRAQFENLSVAPQCPLSVYDLPSGCYMIQFWGGGKIFTGKFVKE
ncbi:MAG: T9SS type A sorting domain-containing protein [Bacteroidales bacterium]|nr:T9SS type A sorting domain-containing protein [Bacteroidales bacterium]MDY0142972.1 T9SS type A sorting domain-containing protein [Bacteroidales bacterium]